MADAGPGRTEYPNPPIVEVVCQVTFADAVPWSVASPGLLWTAIRDEYPSEPNALGGGVEASFGQTQGQNEVRVNQQAPRYVFSNSDQNRRVVTNGSCLSVNGLAPYEKWPSLAARFAKAIDAFSTTIASFVPESVSIRYINRVVIPESRFDLDDYFNVPIFKSHQEGALLQQLVARSRTFVPDTSVQTTITFASADDQTEHESSFVLDIELVQPVQPDAQADDLLSVAEKLHVLENREFESSITAKTRELFYGNDR
ncbi:TIGR04255 family protein [Mycolicibacterium mageritense]|uniref:TIGR04255 family protein n=1 Tax=Mycolicibacterium mageritense TaxID=53462 RepID=UPI0022A73BA5|nr:TIGR04255 family protein [Mycolicibacterium mageritense]